MLLNSSSPLHLFDTFTMICYQVGGLGGWTICDITTMTKDEQ